MARFQPWRWSSWGARCSDLPPIPEEQIKPIAELLSRQRPWLSAEENCLAAEHALRQKPWRPWVIRFSGDKERSGWDWAELLIKVSVPIIIVGLSSAYSSFNSEQQQRINQANQNDLVVSEYIKELQQLVLDRKLNEAAVYAPVSTIARSTTLTALSRLKEPSPYKHSSHKGQIIVFLHEAGLIDETQNISLNGANLRMADISRAFLLNADLRGADFRNAWLREADLSGAKLNGAKLNGADLSGALLLGAKLVEVDLSGAILNAANLTYADLSGSDLSSITWDERTAWPDKSKFEQVRNLPERLMKQLRL